MLSYREMALLPTFEERFLYLQLDGTVAYETFGSNRYANQALYTSSEWRRFRHQIIIRDQGCDLGIPDRVIHDHIIIHHLNPISMQDIVSRSEKLFDPDNVVCVSKQTHNAIHYGDGHQLIPSKPARRYANDTCPWKEAL